MIPNTVQRKNRARAHRIESRRRMVRLRFLVALALALLFLVGALAGCGK